MDWTDENIAHYDRLFREREKRRSELRHIPAVIDWFGTTVEIPGWHDGTPRFRIPDDLLPANFSAGIIAAGNRPSYRRSPKFGNAQKRITPTNRKVR